MPRQTDDPVHYIVSFRVNNHEKKQLARLAQQKGLSVSTYVRKVLNMLNDGE